MAQVFNNSFREAAAAGTYPFTGASSFEQDWLKISSRVFLDALLYPLSGFTAPFCIGKLSTLTPDHAVRVTVRDSARRLVATADCPSAAGAGYFIDPNDRLCGVLVYDTAEMEQLRDTLANRELTLDADVLCFNASLCFSVPVDGQLYIKTDKGQVSDDVVLAAAGGVHFTLDDSGADDVVRVNLYGEEKYLIPPIKRIKQQNRPAVSALEDEHLWLAADPASAIRIRTADGITIGKERDFGYSR